MKDYFYMDSAIGKICESLTNESEKWVFGNKTFYNKEDINGIEFWSGYPDYSINKIWNGVTTEEVFSENQGRKIKKAYDVATEKQASITQNKILNNFKK